MPIHHAGIATQLFRPRLGLSLCKRFNPTTNLYNSRRNVDQTRRSIDPQLLKDYLLVLPEQLKELPATNELVRLPKINEPEWDFTKLSPETVYKGLNQKLCSYRDFVTTINTEVQLPELSIEEFFNSIEQNLYPMDTAFHTLYMMSLITNSYDYPQIRYALNSSIEARSQRFSGKFRDFIQYYAIGDQSNYTAIQKKLLKSYLQFYPPRAQKLHLNEASLIQYQSHLRELLATFQRNTMDVDKAFTYTIDDPDVLKAISNDLTVNNGRNERTPVTVTPSTYYKFMRICPDRFVRQGLWQNYNKRCSPKSPKSRNNATIISNLRVLRRKIADILGNRTHVEWRLSSAMADSRQQVLDSLKSINQINRPKMIDCVQELEEYADDNELVDSQTPQIQEYDVGYLIHRYKHDILIGRSEFELRNYLPFDTVFRGLCEYSKKYLAIEVKDMGTRGLYGDAERNMRHCQLVRNGVLLGTLIYEPYHSDQMKFTDHSMSLLRARSKLFDTAPLAYMSTGYQRNPSTNQAQLSFDDVMNLFTLYGTALQSLLRNYQYYELNRSGALEVEAENMLRNICATHLLSDHRILQACSDIGNSKSLDIDTCTRIIRASTHFNPMRTWEELYQAHLDIEAHSVLSDLRPIIKDAYDLYSPFKRDQDNYDYCAMKDIFVGPNDGVKYASLWSKQLATHTLDSMISSLGAKNMSELDVDKIRNFNDKLIDTLYHPDDINTSEKLSKLLGSQFEPLKTGLGVL